MKKKKDKPLSKREQNLSLDRQKSPNEYFDGGERQEETIELRKYKDGTIYLKTNSLWLLVVALATSVVWTSMLSYQNPWIVLIALILWISVVIIVLWLYFTLAKVK